MDKPSVQSRALRSQAAQAPAPRIRADGESTRGLILDAARRRLIDQGYANLNVRDIAADAGVNHALIGYHFRGKQQLVLAVLDDANTRLLERQTRMYRQTATAERKWRQACAFYDEDLNSGFVKLQMELMGASFHDEALRLEYTPRLLAWIKLIEGAVQQFIDESDLQLPVSARAISSWIGLFWVGLEASMALQIPEEQGHQREALRAMSTLLQHVQPRRIPRKVAPKKRSR